MHPDEHFLKFVRPGQTHPYERCEKFLRRSISLLTKVGGLGLSCRQQMRTDVFRAFGTDGKMHVVFRRTQTYFVRDAYGVVEKQREPRFYLDNGDALECAERYDTFRTLNGDMVLRVMTSTPKKQRDR